MHSEEQFDLFSGIEDVRHLHHNHGLETEVLALSKVAPRLAAMKAAIYARLEQEGEFGLTPDEYAEEHGLLINTVRRRFTDLWKEGWIRHHPEELTRGNADGNQCVVWVKGRDPNCSGTTEQKIERLRAQLTSLGVIPCC